jgi:serine/threonine protein kinase
MPESYNEKPLWGHWYLKELLGKGGYGAVYRAVREETVSGKPFIYEAAVKHISIPQDKSELDGAYDNGYVSDEQSAMRFYEEKAEAIIKENQLMYQLKGSRNIVTYEDHLLVPKEDMPGYDLYIRMELLTPLARHIRDQKLSQADVIKIGVDICRALEELLDHNVIHRDVKLSNIFVDGKGNYKLGDFGVARQMEKSQTFMSKKGTSEYMAPEVFKGERAGKTVDLYALGLVLYRLLNGGRGPFLPEIPHRITPDDLETAQFRRMAGDPLPPPPAANEALAKIVLRACAFRSEDRFKTPAAFRKALERYRAGEHPPEDEPVKDKPVKGEIVAVDPEPRTRQIILGGDSPDAGIPGTESRGVSDAERERLAQEEADRQKRAEEDAQAERQRKLAEEQQKEQVRKRIAEEDRKRKLARELRRKQERIEEQARRRAETRKNTLLFLLGTLLPVVAAVVITPLIVPRRGDDSYYIQSAIDAGHTFVFPAVWLAMALIPMLWKRLKYLALGVCVHAATAIIAYLGYYSAFSNAMKGLDFVAIFHLHLAKLFAGEYPAGFSWVTNTWLAVEMCSVAAAVWLRIRERRKAEMEVYGDA